MLTYADVCRRMHQVDELRELREQVAARDADMSRHEQALRMLQEQLQEAAAGAALWKVACVAYEGV